MNSKAKGELGQSIAIGELAKYGITCALPMSDNLPFDFIIIYKNKLFKAQVKSSTQEQTENSRLFYLVSNNWHKKTRKKYTHSDVDVMVLCDYEKVYLLAPPDFSERASFSIRYEASKNGQSKNINLAKDYILSEERLEQVLGAFK